MSAAIDMTGRRCGRLTALRPAGKAADKSIAWLCRCDCGAEITTRGTYLRIGKTRSCGCIAIVHGHATRKNRSPEYAIWVAMRDRCSNPANKAFKNYGGRGITVCKRWNSFSYFISDMRPRPSMAHLIERKNNNRGYTPKNCKWATRKQQTRNTRVNHIVEFRSRKMPLIEATELAGMPYDLVRTRINRLKWAPARALTEPVHG